MMQQAAKTQIKLNPLPGMGISPMMKTASSKTFVAYSDYKTKKVAVESARRAEAYRAAAEKRIDSANINYGVKSFLKGVVADTPANTLAMFGSAAFGAELAMRNPKLADDALVFGVVSMGKAIKDTAKENPARLAGQVVGAVAAGKAVGKVAGKKTTVKATKAAKPRKVAKPLSKEQRLAASVAKKKQSRTATARAKKQFKQATKPKASKPLTKEQRLAAAVAQSRKSRTTLGKAKKRIRQANKPKTATQLTKEQRLAAAVKQKRASNSAIGKTKTAIKQAKKPKVTKPLTKEQRLAANVASKRRSRSAIGKTKTAISKARKPETAKPLTKEQRLAAMVAQRKYSRSAVGRTKKLIRQARKPDKAAFKRTVTQEFNSLRGKVLNALKGKPSKLSRTKLSQLQYELDYASNLYKAKRINGLKFRQKMRKINAEFEAFERAERAQVIEPVSIKASRAAPATKKTISAGVNKQGKKVRNLGQEFKQQQKPQGNAIASGSGDQVLLQQVKTKVIQKQVQVQATKIKQVQEVAQKTAVKQQQITKLKINGKVKTVQKMSAVTAMAVLVARPMLATATRQALLQTARPILKPAYAQRYAQAQAQRPRQAQRQATKQAVRQAVKQTPRQAQQPRPAQKTATATRAVPTMPKLLIGSSDKSRNARRTRGSKRGVTTQTAKNKIAGFKELFG
jgi:hypothetical protein